MVNEYRKLQCDALLSSDIKLCSCHIKTNAQPCSHPELELAPEHDALSLTLQLVPPQIVRTPFG